MTVSVPLIREPRPADVEELASVHLLGWRDTCGHLLPEKFYGEEALERRKRQWTTWTREAGNRPTGTYLRVAEVDGRVIGVAEDNPRARAFYRRNGFTSSGIHRVETELNDLAEVRLVR